MFSVSHTTEEGRCDFSLVGHWIATKKHKIRLRSCHRIIPVILSYLYTSLTFPLYLGCEVVSESMVLYSRSADQSGSKLLIGIFTSCQNNENTLLAVNQKSTSVREGKQKCTRA